VELLAGPAHLGKYLDQTVCSPTSLTAHVDPRRLVHCEQMIILEESRNELLDDSI
jgi:hypothetical protein